MKVWWTCVYKLQSSVILKDWLCTFIEMVNLMVMSKERRRFWPGTHPPPPPKKKKKNQTFVTTHNTLINWYVLSPREHSKAHISSQTCQIRPYNVNQRFFFACGD